MKSTLLTAVAVAAIASTVSSSSSSSASFTGTYFSGVGDINYLQLLDTSRQMWEVNSPFLEGVPQLYFPGWNAILEGPTWAAYWTTNSYGGTMSSLPFLQEPLLTFVQTAQNFWFINIGNGNRSGGDSGPAPDGCLCDAATPTEAYYKQGDGNVPIHDWALEETVSALVMQAELLLVQRDVDTYLNFHAPLFNRTINFIEQRRDPATQLFLCGDSSNVMAPSYGAWLLPNGTRVPAYLAGMTMTYGAALARIRELEYMSGRTARGDYLAGLYNATVGALDSLLAPTTRDYFVKSIDPNGTLHGVLGQELYGYIEAVVNHDAIAFRIVNESLGTSIMNRMLTLPPGLDPSVNNLRPYNFTITNYPGLEDMETPPTSWLWQYGTWVNGGAWSSCEARMMLAYYYTNRPYEAVTSMETMMGFATAFRMDNPLPNFGSEVYQPSEPINVVLDNFAVPAALVRGLFEYQYSAEILVLLPHYPNATITSITQLFPITFGNCRLFITSSGSGDITNAQVNGKPLPPPSSFFDVSSVTLSYADLACGSISKNNSNVRVDISIQLGTSAVNTKEKEEEEKLETVRNDVEEEEEGKIFETLSPITSSTSSSTFKTTTPSLPSHHHHQQQLHFLDRFRSHAAQIQSKAAKAVGPPVAGAALWLDASQITGVTSGSLLSSWQDMSGNNNAAIQLNASHQPMYTGSASGGFPNGLPAVRFDGGSSFLQGTNVTLNSSPGSTILSVFMDMGSQTTCCSGVFFSQGGCNGLSTKVSTGCTNSPVPGINCTVVMIDWSGSADSGTRDISNQPVVVAVSYNSSSSMSFVNSCAESTEPAEAAASNGVYMIGSRNNEDFRYFNGYIAEVLVYTYPLTDAERQAVEVYLSTKWQIPLIPAKNCTIYPPVNCSLAPALVDLQINMTQFLARMVAAGYLPGRYEVAHAQMFLDAITTWDTRCAMIANGTLPLLPSPASQTAADNLFVATAGNLGNGLVSILTGYATSTDPDQRAIYNIFMNA